MFSHLFAFLYYNEVRLFVLWYGVTCKDCKINFCLCVTDKKI